MAHELWCVTGNKIINITPLIGNLSWRSNINELGEQLDFDIAFNDDRFFPQSPVNLGSLMILKNKEKEINRTIVVTQQKNGRGSISYNCFDYAFYSNKSKETYQFNKISASSAIVTVFNKVGIPIGNINISNIPITKIYSDKVHSDVIKDILDIVEKETGTKYRKEMREGKIYIEKQSDLIITPTFKLADNISPEFCVNAINNPTRKRSIEEMKNSIKIITGDEKKVKTVVEVKDEGLIKQFGLLQEVVNVSDEEVPKAKEKAKNMLKDLGKVFEENGITLPGDDDIRAGRILEIKEPVTGMKGKYLINSAQHTVKNGIHLVQVGLGVV